MRCGSQPAPSAAFWQGFGALAPEPGLWAPNATAPAPACSPPQAFRVADLDLPKDKTTGGNAINLAPGAAGLDASALHDLDSAWQGADLDADLDAQYGGAAGAGLLQGAGGNDLLFGAGDGMDMYGAGEFTEAREQPREF